MNFKKIIVAALAAVFAFDACTAARKTTLFFGDGEELEPDDSLTFSVEDFPETVGGYPVLAEYLPDGIEVTWTGKKFKAPKKGKVKYSRREEDFVTTSDDNPCGLSVKYSKKKGVISGSFKVYAQKSEKKLKSYTAKFSGRLGGTISVSVKNGASATASFE